MKSASRQIYDVLSRIGHSRRSGMRDAISAHLREMATGPHPDPLIQAEYVEWSSHIIEEVVQIVGDALGRFFPQGWYLSQIRSLVDALECLRTDVPLDGPARASIGRR